MIKRTLFLLLLLSSTTFGAYTEFYVQTTGSNLNAGSTTSAAAAFTYTSAVVAGGWNQSTGVFTVASGNPSSDGVAVGMFASIHLTSATVTTYVARITAVSSTTITVSISGSGYSGSLPATDALGATTMHVGGAWKGPNGAIAFPLGNNIASSLTNAAGDTPRVNFKSGSTYSITAAMTHSVAGPIRFQGYTTTPNDQGRAVIDGGTSGVSYVLLTLSGANNDLVDFTFSNNGASGSAHGLVISGTECTARRIVVTGMLGCGINFTGGTGVLAESEAYNCNLSNTATLGGISTTVGSSTVMRCISHDNPGSNGNGFVFSAFCASIGNIADSNAGKGFLISATTGSLVMNCDAYNNTGDGLDLSGASAMFATIENCNFIKNGGYGINSSGAATLRNGSITNCGFGAGTQANTSGQILATLGGLNITGSVTYTADLTPWIDPANGDFSSRLDALARHAGRGTYTQTAPSYTGTISYPNIGATQHAEVLGSTHLPSIND